MLKLSNVFQPAVDCRNHCLKYDDYHKHCASKPESPLVVIDCCHVDGVLCGPHEKKIQSHHSPSQHYVKAHFQFVVPHNLANPWQNDGELVFLASEVHLLCDYFCRSPSHISFSRMVSKKVLFPQCIVFMS